MRNATIVYLIDRDRNLILLGKKKRGFGLDTWNGYGGKVQKGEEIEETAIREIQEETMNPDTGESILINPKDLLKVAVLDFTFPHQPDWDQQVHVFITYQWEGEAYESEEMEPKWWDISQLPYDLMWKDDIYWLPKVLSGEEVTAQFTFNEDGEITYSNVNTIPLS